MLKEKNLNQEKLFAENDQCVLNGKLTGRFQFSHELKGKKFYSNIIKIKRLSNVVDEIPIIVSGRKSTIDFSKDYKDVDCSVLGNIRTRNYEENGKRHLKVYVSATVCDIQERQNELDDNFVFLKGYICKETIYRETLSGRKITDIMVAVNHPTGESSYVPCIAWNANALEAAEFVVGDCVEIKGRIQSRFYVKKYSEKEEQKTAYEVSIGYLKKLV